MAKMNKEQAIRSYVENMGSEDLRELVRDIYTWDGSLDNLEVDPMDSFDELMSDSKPTELAQMIQYGDFNINDDWFGFDGYGNLVSYSDSELDAEIEDYQDDIVDALMNFSGEVRDVTLQSLIYASDDAVFNDYYMETK